MCVYSKNLHMESHGDFPICILAINYPNEHLKVL